MAVFARQIKSQISCYLNNSSNNNNHGLAISASRQHNILLLLLLFRVCPREPCIHGYIIVIVMERYLQYHTREVFEEQQLAHYSIITVIILFANTYTRMCVMTIIYIKSISCVNETTKKKKKMLDGHAFFVGFISSQNDFGFSSNRTTQLVLSSNILRDEYVVSSLKQNDPRTNESRNLTQTHNTARLNYVAKTLYQIYMKKRHLFKTIFRIMFNRLVPGLTHKFRIKNHIPKCESSHQFIPNFVYFIRLLIFRRF